MKFKHITYLVIVWLIGVLIACALLEHQKSEELNKQLNETRQDFQDYKQRMQRFEKLEQVTSEVARHDYTENYKCEDFSKDLVGRLAKEGIQAEVVYGESPKTLRQDKVMHAWTAVWIESQTGHFTVNYAR